MTRPSKRWWPTIRLDEDANPAKGQELEGQRPGVVDGTEKERERLAQGDGALSYEQEW
jgi:hypothetical protein